jgi:serine/threonine-protein kinase
MASPATIGESDFDRGRAIGGGNVAEVYEGVERASGRRVVLKYVNVETEEEARYFQREITVMAQMTHPATLSMIGCSLPSAARRSGLIVMEYLPNQTLEELNKATYKNTAPHAWTPTARSKAVFGMTAGMCVVHSLGILHRDLKPANVFLDANWEIRIADFGRSRVLSESGMTAACGTPLTQAPETYEGEIYTNKVDVYSFAMCLYLLFRPADRLDDGGPLPKNAIQMMRRISDGARFVADPRIPDYYWALITQCWQKSPDARPSFAQLLQRLRADRDWVFEGTDEAALAEYQARVAAGLVQPAVPEFEPGKAETAAPTEQIAPPPQETPPWWKNCLLL